MQLHIHRFLPFTRVEGPGDRACLWVQGCSICCDGCAASETWNKNGGFTISVEDLTEKILLGDKIEGITFAGGEPFEQAEALAELGIRLKRSGLSIMTFTGYLYEDLMKSSRKGFKELISITDILIDGPYIKEKTDFSRPWVGSSNQRYHFLTSRYRYIEAYLYNIPNKIEIIISEDGRLLINGMGDFEKIKKIYKLS